MTFPREEEMAALVGDGEYVEHAQWRLFVDPTGELEGKHVLLVMGDRWTMWSAGDFRTFASRILGQL